ncbi:chromosome associated protein D3 [Lycorma delicatula]|uniref:chromosome associated protein D3 n=1 Tax=Lycorma delicatula TaxID=130591 RepID=UPI003F5172C7
MELIDVFGKFQLELLPVDWVTEIWNNQFAEPADLPVEYELHLENIPIRQLMNETCACVKQWLATSELCSSVISEVNHSTRLSDVSSLLRSCSTISAGNKSWQNLLNLSIQHKPLLCLLSTFIHQGKINSLDENVRQVCLGATNLYFILLSIPGSKVYNIFNPVLYAHAVESLKMCSLLDSGSNKQTTRAKTSRRNTCDSDSSDDTENEVCITGSSKVTLTKSLNILLNDMLYLLQRFQLKHERDSLILTIQILVLMTRLEKRVSNFLVNSPSQPSTTSLAHNAYIVLRNLCDPEHGDVQETVKLIMRELLPSIFIVDQRGSLITAKEAVIIKDHSVLFIKKLLMSIKEKAYVGVKALIQHLCVRLPDRAEARAKGVQIIYEVMSVLPYSFYSEVVVWIMKLCHNDEVKNRITGLELVSKLLFTEEKFSSEADDFQTSHNSSGNVGNTLYIRYSLFSSHKFLLAVVFSRCLDLSATVRAKSLSIIASVVSSNNPGMKQEVESIFLQPFENTDLTEESDLYKKEFFDMHKFLLHFDIEEAREFDPLPGVKAIFDMLELFVEDPKVFVRKSALQVLANVFLLSSKWMTEKRLEVLVSKCRDISVSVRKMLVQCLTELLDRYPTHPKLPLYWVRGVLPLLADQELKSQEKVLEVLECLILRNFVPFDKMKTPHQFLPWILLDLIGELKMRKLFVFACHKWTLDKILKQSIVNVVQTHIGTRNNDAAWFFLSAVSEYMDIKNLDFCVEYFNQHVHNASEINEYSSQLVMEVLFLNWHLLTTKDQVELCSQLLSSLNLYSVPLPLIARYIDICQFLTEHLADDKETGRQRVKEWAGKLVKMSQKYLNLHVGPDAPEQVADEEILAQHIFTLGDALQICPEVDTTYSFKLLHYLLNPCSEFEEVEEGQKKQWHGTVAATVSAVAVVTLGKMSLQKEKTAKSLVPLFGILLSTSTQPQIKINTMIALADLCTKYTSVVEKLLPDMCMCLRDNDLSVRENTLTLLIQLIQEDYLKLRCPLLFHLLSMLLDEKPSIRDMISVFIENSVLSKQKNIMVQHFVESLFHYNDYTDHPAYSKVVMNFKEQKAFSLAGPDKQEKRRYIYRYMLEHMMDDHRFRTTYNICTDVLAGVVEGTVILNEQGMAVLQDALYSLSSSEIRLSHLRPGGKDNDDDDGDQGEEINVAQVITNMAKKTIISQVVKKNVIENIVPTIIRLKHKLKQLKSPLVKDLMAYLRELMKDYKNEINDILAADKELAAEVLFDLESTAEESSEEESGDELARVVKSNEGNLRSLLMEAVVHVERLSSTLLISSAGDNKNNNVVETSDENQVVNVDANTGLQKNQEQETVPQQPDPIEEIKSEST